MEKKRGVNLFLIFSIFIIFFLSSISFIHASGETETEKINKAYSCLIERIKEKECDNLTTEEKIFSLLSVNRCRNELISDSYEESTCWPGPFESNCKIKQTAQSIISLGTTNTEKSQEWLLSRTTTPQNLEWYIQVDSQEPTSCEIKDGTGSFKISILENKKLELAGSPDPCLSISSNGYWVQVSSVRSCQDKEFKISCDESFSTSLLFKKQQESTIYVYPAGLSSSSSGGETKEKINSLCFHQNNQCNYEGSLWAALALKSKGKDISPYLPYLITFANDNKRLMPSSFLYYLTESNEYLVKLLSLKKLNGYWEESGNRLYDTAMAHYPSQNNPNLDTTKSKEWLLSQQGNDGCWGNLVDTGFILVSLWPGRSPTSSNGGGTTPDPDSCLDMGFYCVSSEKTCSDIGGQEKDYACAGSFNTFCCSRSPTQTTCSELNGVICSRTEDCKSGTIVSGLSGLFYGQTCCVGSSAICEQKTTPPTENGDSETETDCEKIGGFCSQNCLSGEIEKREYTYSCGSGKICCVVEPKKGANVFLIILIILIVLVVLGIIFKDKLKKFFSNLKLKSKKKKQGPSDTKNKFFNRGPPPRRIIHTRPIQKTPQRNQILERKILPPEERNRTNFQRTKSRSEKELDDVLKKLKDMGNN